MTAEYDWLDDEPDGDEREPGDDTDELKTNDRANIAPFRGETDICTMQPAWGSAEAELLRSDRESRRQAIIAPLRERMARLLERGLNANGAPLTSSQTQLLALAHAERSGALTKEAVDGALIALGSRPRSGTPLSSIDTTPRDRAKPGDATPKELEHAELLQRAAELFTQEGHPKAAEAVALIRKAEELKLPVQLARVDRTVRQIQPLLAAGDKEGAKSLIDRNLGCQAVGKLEAVTIEELCTPVPPVEWLCEGLGIPKGEGVGMLAAYGGKGKSWLLQNLAMTVASPIESGLRVGGMLDAARGKVVYLDWEMSKRQNIRRIQKQCAALDFSPRELHPNLKLVVQPGFYLTDDGARDVLMTACEGAALVCIDSFAAGCRELEEKSAEAAAPLYMLREVSKKLGCFFLLLHHQRKGKREEGEPYGTEEDLRGSSAIHAALEVAWVGRAEGGSTIFHHAKMRDGRPQGDLRLTIVDHWGAEREHGDPARGGILVRLEAHEEESPEERAEARAAEKKERMATAMQNDAQRLNQAVLDALSDGAGMKVDAVMAKVKAAGVPCNEKSVSGALGVFVSDRRVRLVVSKVGAKVYSKPAPEKPAGEYREVSTLLQQIWHAAGRRDLMTKYPPGSYAPREDCDV